LFSAPASILKIFAVATFADVSILEISGLERVVSIFWSRTFGFNQANDPNFGGVKKSTKNGCGLFMLSRSLVFPT
jgi:hypothetical protein